MPGSSQNRAMIRTKTTFIVGAGASTELQFPGGPELLSRIAQGYDFSRFGTELQTRDSTLLAQYVAKAGERLNKSQNDLLAAAERIRISSKLGTSIHSIIEQHNSDRLIPTLGKIAIAHFICQAEARSLLREKPRMRGDLPVQGQDYWLFYFAQLLTSGVPRTKVDRIFDDVTIINFNWDRTIEHFMPFALEMAFGMPIAEAQQLVAAKLKILRPYGSVGRLQWQSGDAPQVDWGTEKPWNIHNLPTQIFTASERANDVGLLREIRQTVTYAKRLVFLGFAFHPQNMELLIDHSLSHNPEVLTTIYGMTAANRATVIQMLYRQLGLEREDLLTIVNARCFEMLRDYNLMLES
ncbi:hypothetical protein [Novosphingobium marinum]|nr:hypothetical protein [Novosphingobium marinum]